jgi:hypothetical protein
MGYDKNGRGVKISFQLLTFSRLTRRRVLPLAVHAFRAWSLGIRADFYVIMPGTRQPQAILHSNITHHL